MQFIHRRSAFLMQALWVLPCFVALAFMPLPLAAGIGCIGLMTTILVVKRRWIAAFWEDVKSFWPLLSILMLFYASPYTNVAPSMRDPGASFSIYIYLAGPLTILNVAFAVALAGTFFEEAKRGKVNLTIGKWYGIAFLFMMVVVSFAIGLLHADGGILQYGVTELKRPVNAFMSAFYMLAIFMLVINSIKTQDSLVRLLRWLDRLTWMVLGYGIYRLIIIVAYGAETMWMFGLPIVLYDQMAMLYVPIFSSVARQLAGQRVNRMELLQVVVAIAFILCSTRRFNYLLLVMGLVLIIIFRWSTHTLSAQHFRRIVVRSTAVLIVVTGLLVAISPKFIEGVGSAFQSIDMGSRVGQKHGGSVRTAVIRNIFANLDERPYAYVSGFGLGTMWHAVEYQPMDPLTKRLRTNDGWYTQFSVPYVSSLFRMGIVGVLLLLAWLTYYLVRTIRETQVLPSWLQSDSIGMIAYIVMVVPALPDSLNPTGWILCGLYMGLLDRFAALDKQLALAAGHHESQHRST
jgi:hypothetical protein